MRRVRKRISVSTMAYAVDSTRPVGDLFREWRQRRGVSQLGLALKADVSARHLSFVETGRARPSRDMVLRLSEQLGIPLRQRNALLLAAGYAPAFRERSLDDPALAGARQAIDRLLAGHEPYPALAVDRHWNIAATNRSVAPLLADVSPALTDATGQRAAPRLASRRRGATDREPVRVAALRVRAPAASDRCDRRSRADRPFAGAARVPRTSGDRASCREWGFSGARSAEAGQPSRNPESDQHHDGVRDSARRHALGARAGDLLPR